MLFSISAPACLSHYLSVSSKLLELLAHSCLAYGLVICALTVECVVMSPLPFLISGTCVSLFCSSFVRLCVYLAGLCCDFCFFLVWKLGKDVAPHGGATMFAGSERSSHPPNQASQPKVVVGNFSYWICSPTAWIETSLSGARDSFSHSVFKCLLMAPISSGSFHFFSWRNLVTTKEFHYLYVTMPTSAL